MKKRNVFTFLMDNFLLVSACILLWFVYWLFFENKESYYEYEVKVTFCDDRPPRIVTFIDMRCPGIDYTEQSRYHTQALSSFEYNDKNCVGCHTQKLLNVCEITILNKTYLGDYTQAGSDNPF